MSEGNAVLRAAGATTLAIVLAAPTLARAQDGVGSTGAAVLQLPAGSRAAALSGAYVAAAGDADALFYNPAGLAGVGAAASLAYQQHVADITFGSAAGAIEIRPIVIGLAVTYLDAGEIERIEPDPDYGGQRGRETGETVGASESAIRLGVTAPLDRFRFGVAFGMVTSNLAGVTRSAPLLDLGAQIEFSAVTLGAAFRNIGPAMSGGDGVDAPLPTEARIGARFEREMARGLGLSVGVDLASDVRAGTSWLAGGVEAGLLPDADRGFGAVGRIGLDSEAQGDDGLGALRLGAGITLDRIAFDYTYQEFEHFGGIHRIGVRWSRPPH